MNYMNTETVKYCVRLVSLNDCIRLVLMTFMSSVAAWKISCGLWKSH